MIAEKTKRVTIKDVAKEAGLSFATVSRVLNDNPGFPEKTRKKVWDAAHALNYTPNTQARKLRSGKTPADNTKTGIIMYISYSGIGEIAGNDNEGRRLVLISRKAAERGMFPINYWYEEAVGFQCPPILNGYVDGTIMGTPHGEVVDILRAKNHPVVLMDVPFSAGNTDIPMVNMDFRRQLHLQCAKLKELGHEHVAVLTFQNPNADAVSNDAQLDKQIRFAVSESGLHLNLNASKPVNISPKTHEPTMRSVAEKLAKAIKKGDITAIISPDACYTAPIIQTFKTLNVDVPNDVSILGISSEPIAPNNNVTTVGYNWSKLIETSLDLLKRLIDGQESPCTEYLVEPIFHEGTSISQPGGRK